MSEEIRDKDKVTPTPEEPAAAPAQAEAVVHAAAELREAPGSALLPEELERLNNDLVTAIKTVFDPEIPVDIYELGLIYRIEVDGDRNIEIDMTLTAPGCPVAGEMPVWVENASSSVAGVGQVKVNLVFDPPWDMSHMSDEAKVALDMF